MLQEVRIPAAGRKGEPKNFSELKDDTNAAREDKQVNAATYVTVSLRCGLHLVIQVLMVLGHGKFSPLTSSFCFVLYFAQA